MSMNGTPMAERCHIGIFGRRNAGKSSLINAITGQDLAIVDGKAGTTTDPVYKTMELLPLGPVVFIDTPGIDDVGGLGEKRINKTYQVLNKTDLALLVAEGCRLSEEDEQLLERIQQKEIPYVVAYNKYDLWTDEERRLEKKLGVQEICVSARAGYHIEELKILLASQKQADEGRTLVEDLLAEGDQVVLVVPIDKAAPKGRLILPQQQTIRAILDAGACSMVAKEDQLEDLLSSIRKPRLIITDSQVFGSVDRKVSGDIELTSFSILMARYKGVLEEAVEGVLCLKSLRDGDRVLIAEGCTHHRQCDDIGSVKLPAWIRDFTKKDLQFSFSSGLEFPGDLSGYQLVVHCGGCMLNAKEIRCRMGLARDQGVPFTNYGILIAHIHGILERSLEPFMQGRKD